MLVFSSSYQQFTKKLLQLAKIIITEEMNLSFARSRFRHGNYFYPLNIVLFEDDKTLGFFEPGRYRIGIHKDFRYIYNQSDTSKDNIVLNVLRHELAHFIDFIENGSHKQAHDYTFRNICKRYNWKANVYNASTNFSFLKSANQTEKINSKIKKLLSLSTSDNKHEAKVALTKANDLLMTNNITEYCINNNKEEIIYVQKVIEQKIVTPKFLAIEQILELYFVKTVICKPKGSVYLEIIGSKSNVEIGEYIAKFLYFELEVLWKEEKKILTKLSSSAKRSFMCGIADGFIKKLKMLHKTSKHSDKLSIISNALEKNVSFIYPRMNVAKFTDSEIDVNALHLGRNRGENLNIRPGVSDNSSNTRKLLNIF